MGDKKGKKDKAKEHRQTDVKQAEAAKTKKSKQQSATTAVPVLGGASKGKRGA